MKNRLRPLLIGATLVVALAVSMAFAPVRSFAADVLQVFRVKQVQTISFSQEDMDSIAQALSSGEGHVKLEEMGDVWFEGGNPAEPEEVTLAVAEAELGRKVVLPEGMEGTPTVSLQKAAEIRFKLHVDKVNEALKYYGAEKTLPDSLDGKEFSIKINPIVVVAYQQELKGAVVGQGKSPEIVMPEGVNPLVVREVLLGLPFLPDNVKRQIVSVNDWQTTLLVPNFGGSSQEIDLDGTPAVLFTEPNYAYTEPPIGRDPGDPDDPAYNGGEPPYDTSNNAAVVWTNDGIVYAIGGDLGQDQTIAYAKSMLK